MTTDENKMIESFDETILVRINPKESTLPIDTAAEWSKGFMLVNLLIKEMAKSRYEEVYTDGSGSKRKRIVIHPQLLGYLQERRKMLDQIYKMSGGEAYNEAKKEAVKKFAHFLFKMQNDDKIKKKYEKEVKKIIQSEVKNE
ncbi:MAG: hypothetical protein ACTSQY_00015 [Candidatus Odinarchaeia archaeon]